MSKILVVYYSRTGNVRRFLKKVDLETVEIKDGLEIDKDFVLVTPTTGFGDVPMQVLKFLQRNHYKMRAVAASGNRNWGTGFAKSADKVSNMYNVPILLKFELSGTSEDVNNFIEGVNRIEAH